MEASISLRIGSEHPSSGLTNKRQFPVRLSTESRRSDHSFPAGLLVLVQMEVEMVALALRVSDREGSAHSPGSLGEQENRSYLLTSCPLDDAEPVRLASLWAEDQVHSLEERALAPVSRDPWGAGD